MKVKQIRYYGNGDSRNSLSNDGENRLSFNFETLEENFIDFELDNNNRYNEIQIKAYPGTEIEINGESILIGEIGVYNISYEDDIEITSLSVNKESLSHINDIQLAYIVITLTQYDKKTEGDDTNDTGNTETPKPVEEENSSDDGTSSSNSQEEIVKDNHDSRL